MSNKLKIALGLSVACLTSTNTLPITELQANVATVVGTLVGGAIGLSSSESKALGAIIGGALGAGVTYGATYGYRPSVRFERAERAVAQVEANALLRVVFAPDKDGEYKRAIERVYVSSQYPLVCGYNSLNDSKSAVELAVGRLEKARWDSRDPILSNNIVTLQSNASALHSKILDRMLWIKDLPTFNGQYTAMVAEQQAAEKLRLERERVAVERDKAHAEHRKADAEHGKAAAQLANAGVNVAKFARGDK